MFEKIGCSMHYGVSHNGLKGAVSALNRRFPELSIHEIPEVDCPEEGLANLKNLNSVAASCERIASEESRVLQEGKTPLFFGGDHAAAIGTVAGSAAGTQRLGLLWIDAHTDINTDVTTITGNIHGMSVSALLGYGHPKLCHVFGEDAKLRAEDVVFFGIRDMDPLEEDIIEKLNIRCYTFTEIRTRGLALCLQEALRSFGAISGLHISFDLDSMDPAVIRGVTVPVKDGFTEEEVLSMFGYLQGHGNIRSIDIVEYNPALDSDGKTAEFVRQLTNKITNA